jgi:hypothetical protein
MAFIALNIMPHKKTWCDTKFIEERGGKRKKPFLMRETILAHASTK